MISKTGKTDENEQIDQTVMKITGPPINFASQAKDYSPSKINIEDVVVDQMQNIYENVPEVIIVSDGTNTNGTGTGQN